MDRRKGGQRRNHGMRRWGSIGFHHPPPFLLPSAISAGQEEANRVVEQSIGRGNGRGGAGGVTLNHGSDIVASRKRVVE